jgi:hypothetical protein
VASGPTIASRRTALRTPADARVRLTVHKEFMKKPPVIISLTSLALAVIIFVFADGARAVYSGLFFVVLAGVVVVTSWMRARKGAE